MTEEAHERRAPESRTHDKLPGAVYWFGATSFTNDLASEMVYPLLPAFVTRTLGGGALALGVLDGAAEAVASLFKLLSGYASERRERRGVLVVTGYAIAALVRPLMALSAAAWQVIALRTVDRLGKGVRSAPRDVMIADVVPAAQRGRAFGVHRAADHAGAVVGPLVAAGLLALGLAVREVFWIAVVPGLAAAVLAAIAVRKAQTAPGTPPTEKAVNEIGVVPVTGGRSAVSVVILLALASMMRMPETLLLLRAQDAGISVAAIPLLWAALHVVRSLASVPGGMLADRIGPRPVILSGWLLYALFVVLFARVASVQAAWAVFLSFGLVAALTESPERAWIASIGKAARRGRAFGWYHAAIGVAALPGAALLGWLYQSRGPAFALTISAAATAVLAVAGLAVPAPPGRKAAA